MHKCPRCKEEKELSEFPIINKKTGKITYCKPCKQDYDREYWNKVKEVKNESKRSSQNINRHRNRSYIVNLLKTSNCLKCGISDWRVLEFHHRDREYKEFNLSDCGVYSIEKIQKEIDKCDILCANCHRILTIEQRGYYKYIK